MWLMILFNYLSYTVVLIRLGLNKYGQPDSCSSAVPRGQLLHGESFPSFRGKGVTMSNSLNGRRTNKNTLEILNRNNLKRWNLYKNY